MMTSTRIERGRGGPRGPKTAGAMADNSDEPPRNSVAANMKKRLLWATLELKKPSHRQNAKRACDLNRLIDEMEVGLWAYAEMKKAPHHSRELLLLMMRCDEFGEAIMAQLLQSQIQKTDAGKLGQFGQSNKSGSTVGTFAPGAGTTGSENYIG